MLVSEFYDINFDMYQCNVWIPRAKSIINTILPRLLVLSNGQIQSMFYFYARRNIYLVHALLTKMSLF